MIFLKPFSSVMNQQLVSFSTSSDVCQFLKLPCSFSLIFIFQLFCQWSWCSNIQHADTGCIYMSTCSRSLWTLQLSQFLPLHYSAAVSLIRLMPMTALILIKHHYWFLDAHFWEIQCEFLVNRFCIFDIFKIFTY